MEFKTHHWLIALVGALLAHLSLLSLFERPAAAVTPARGILIELGNGGGAGAAASELESLSPLDAEALPELEPVALETIEPDSVSEVQPEALDATELVIAESPAPKKPEAVILRKPKPKKHKKAHAPKHKKEASKTHRDEKVAKGGAPKAAGGGRKTGEGSDKQATGRSSGASAAAARSRYLGQVSAWLNRNKRYPKHASKKGQQGSVTVRFTVDRNGRVLSSSVVRSSGYTALDDEVRALLRRGRMPRMPKTMQQAQMTITVPIRFRLR